MGTAFHVLKKNHKSLNGQFNSQIITVLSLLFIFTKIAYAEDVSKPDTAPCDPWAAQIAALEGRAEIQSPKQAQWRSVKTGDYLCPGDRLKILDSRAALLLPNETVVRLNEATTIHFMLPQQPAWMELLQGAVHFITRTPRRFEIKTPYLNAAVEGTEFLLAHDKSSELNVFEGTVSAYNSLGKLKAVSGQGAIAHADSAPQLVARVNLRNAVQWALYYPPVLPHPAINEPIQAGGINAWRDRLKAIPEAQRDIAYYNSLGSLQLYQGKVDAARASITQALASATKDDPNYGNALALRSIIELVGGDPQQALASATSATQLAPKSPAPWLALSYVQQGLFQLPQALASARRSVDLATDNALAKARLAELTLAQGDYNRAVSIAEHAAQLNPNLSRVQMILGYAHLSAFDLHNAQQAFTLATQLDPSDPMSRLGLGLVAIRSGELSTGRRQIELATVLDPGNAILRSYLGKAYYEEHRNPLAATQFQLAQSLDPKDPTPWFYDAIRKQTLNRPVDALQDLQKSIQLNDNRAVYRSRLLLDEDLATRGTSLAHIYNDIGFDQLGINESAKSLGYDPTNHSAHRFLSDSYSTRPRHESARASELLQSQLLQPSSMNPVQPRLAETNLNLPAGVGPTDIAFNEFTSVFTRDQLQITGSAVAGSNDTLGDELVLSGIQGRFSYSVGQFHYETDGFRPRSGIEHDIVNLFGQVALSNTIDLQFELRRRKTEQGDLRLNFDPSFVPSETRRTEQDTARIGLHATPSPSSDFLLSVIHTDTENTVDIALPPFTLNDEGNQKGDDLQGQYMFRADGFNTILGLGVSDIDGISTRTIRFAGSEFPDPPRDLAVEQENAYVYTNFHFLDNVIGTLGISYDVVDDKPLGREFDEVSPKLGIQWHITDQVRLRAAAFKTLKRTLITKQTIEPTQVAGFNQIFDDFNAASAEFMGAGLDIGLSATLHTGVEVTSRDVETPQLPGGAIESAEHEEDFHRAYFYWGLSDKWALTGEYRFEKVRRDFNRPPNPDVLETSSLPLTLRYFDPGGLFGQLSTTYVEQKLEFNPTAAFTQTRDDFVVVDAAVGYRLPNRQGVVSLEVKNLFDEEFLFQDLLFIRSDKFESNPRYLPDRIILGRITLNF